MTAYPSREITPRLQRAMRMRPGVVQSGLRAFLGRTPDCVAAILAYNGREAVKLEDRLWAIPIGHLLA